MKLAGQAVPENETVVSQIIEFAFFGHEIAFGMYLGILFMLCAVVALRRFITKQQQCLSFRAMTSDGQSSFEWIQHDLLDEEPWLK